LANGNAMSGTEENEVAMLAAAFTHLGAEPLAATTMARQTLKRAHQLAAERGVSREEALAYLLRLVRQGAAGEAPPEFPGGPPPA
jgi:hypothetical protein